MSKRWSMLFLVLPVVLAGKALCAPVPGDVFREYYWYNEEGDAGQALRVGGKKGQFHPDRGSSHGYVNAPVDLPHEFDLEHAIKAEVVVEKILCHDGTRGLAIRINDNEWIEVPECRNIPEPQWEYQHHTYPTVPVPLEQLQKGANNRFQMRVSAEHTWNWPQNLINGVHFRIYYDPAGKDHPTGHVTWSQQPDGKIESVRLAIEQDDSGRGVRRVEYVGFYEDVNLEGDGVYTQWHYHFLHGAIANHIGTALKTPWNVLWDTSWVPDQERSIRISARIMNEAGIIFMTEPAELSLRRPGVLVELCKPYDVPKKWVTRDGEKFEHFDLAGDPGKAVAMQLVWSSWSPGYMNGVYVNDSKVFDCEGPRYKYYAHRVTLDDTSMLRRGRNTLKTGMTPRYNGKMVHGMEVNWPGIMVLVRYEDRQAGRE